MGKPKYPDVTVDLIGGSGNVFAIIGSVSRSLRHNGVSEEEITEFRREATSGDYDNALATVMEWVDVQ